MDTILDILDGTATRGGDRPVMRIVRDDGTDETWSFRDLRFRARCAAWRLRAIGLEPGDRLLTWSPSAPELPAVYFGAMLARLVLVPLDLRMAADSIERIAARAEARHLALGSGRDAPDPREARLEGLPTTTVDRLAAVPDDTFPADWEAQLAAWPRPGQRRHLRARLHVRHDRQSQGGHAQPRQRPCHDLGHLQGHPAARAPDRLAAAAVPPARAGRRPLLRADVRRRHPLRAEPQSAGHLRGHPRPPHDVDDPRAPGPRPVLVRDRARGREVGPDAQLRPPAVDRPPPPATPPAGCSSAASTPSSAADSGCSSPPAAFLPPALQQAWEDLGVVVIQGYGSTECGFASCTTREDHGLGTVGRPRRRSSSSSPTTARSSSAGPTSSGLLARRGGDRRGAHRRRAGTARATSAGSTPRGG